MPNQPKAKILIVDDEVEVLNMLSQRLKKHNFNVIKAQNGADGLKIARQKKPDLILLDLLMPKMDGLTVLKKIRQEKSIRKTPVIILSNLGSFDKISQAFKYQAHDYLIKSDRNLSEIVRKIKKKLRLE